LEEEAQIAEGFAFVSVKVHKRRFQWVAKERNKVDGSDNEILEGANVRQRRNWLLGFELAVNIKPLAFKRGE